jgi:superoxide dismutase, Cu-Zn family
MRGARSAGVTAVAVLALAGTAAPAFGQTGPQTAVARMVTSEGAAAGRVDLISLEALFVSEEGGESGADAGGSGVLTGRLARQEENLVLVAARLRGLPRGFHGFHVHETGSCERPSFTSAGGHVDPAGANHPNHAGDMPVLQANGDGTALAGFFTDRFGLSQLFDADGSAIVVHANPDNYANIPPDRYDPDPDATTLATGDAGARIACGVVSRGRPSDPFEEGPLARATAQIRRSDGSPVGFAAFARFGGKVLAFAFLERLRPGFHGLHVHETGRCETPSFASAGGHFNPSGAAHGEHAGDLPLAYVTRARFALSFSTTDRFRIRDLLDPDGSAIVLHENPDNYANIPTDRYDPDPDATTLATGDAGARIACGVVRRLVRCTLAVTPRRLRAGEPAILRARVRSGGRPVREATVLVRGPGFSEARPTNARGIARFTLRPQRPGRVRIRVESGLETLGCSTTRPIAGGRAQPALAGRAQPEGTRAHS